VVYQAAIAQVRPTSENVTQAWSSSSSASTIRTLLGSEIVGTITRMVHLSPVVASLVWSSRRTDRSGCGGLVRCTTESPRDLLS